MYRHILGGEHGCKQKVSCVGYGVGGEWRRREGPPLNESIGCVDRTLSELKSMETALHVMSLRLEREANRNEGMGTCVFHKSSGNAIFGVLRFNFMAFANVYG